MKIYLEKILTGCFVFILSLIMIRLTETQIQVASLAGVSPRAVPLLVGKGVLILSLVMIAQGGTLYFISRRTGSAALSEVRFQAFPFLLFLMIIAYALVMQFAGYIIASFTILPLMMYMLRIREIRSYAILAGLVLFIFMIIDILLKIRLPKLGFFGII